MRVSKQGMGYLDICCWKIEGVSYVWISDYSSLDLYNISTLLGRVTSVWYECILSDMSKVTKKILRVAYTLVDSIKLQNFISR